MEKKDEKLRAFLEKLVDGYGALAELVDTHPHVAKASGEIYRMVASDIQDALDGRGVLNGCTV